MRRLFPLLLACHVLAAVPVAATTWTDALGRRVELHAAPHRIVSLVPSVTEVLFALGLGERVVGVTDYADYPSAARRKPHVGSYAAPSLEAIVAARPDMVFAAGDVDPPALVARLGDLGIPVYVVYPRSIADTLTMLERLGAVTGVPAAGKQLSEELRRTVARVEAAVAGQPPVRVLLFEMVQPQVVAAPGTLEDDLLRTAGGVNVVPSGTLRYPTWGPEGVLAADPEAIIVAPFTGAPDPTHYFRRWPELSAVKHGRISIIDPDWLQFPGPRLACGLVALARALHGVDVVPEGPACAR